MQLDSASMRTRADDVPLVMLSRPGALTKSQAKISSPRRRCQRTIVIEV